MDSKKYLQRLKYNGNLEPSLHTLKSLQKAHLRNIPFENLDIHYKNPIELNLDKIYDKIISRKRGGFCYELNGLFYQLLQTLGFQVKMVSARVHSDDGNYSQEYDHMTLIVTIDEKDYLTDVGFGDFLIGPLEIDSNAIQQDESGNYQVDKIDEKTYRINKVVNNQTIPEFIFKNQHAELGEFGKMCHYHQTSTESHFTQRKLISIPTESGRITLTSDKLKIRKGDNIQEISVENEPEFEGYLWKYFKIIMKN